MTIPTMTLNVTLDVWSFDCYTQSCNVMLGDQEIGQIEITDEEGFLCRYKRIQFAGGIHEEPDMTPKGIPAKLEIPYSLSIPERTIDAS